MRLSARNRIDPSEAEEVSDEVVLTWAPCAKHDKSYEVEMWDLGEERKEKKIFDFISHKISQQYFNIWCSISRKIQQKFAHSQCGKMTN